ncbi:maleylacetoacetate isomerase [Sinorhizobium meliloti]|nr:maleylacetoacetate isomerase [Sinorhizobium meliloti]
MAATLYQWPPSSASYRLRIALGLKGLRPTEVVPVNLRTGEQRGPDYLGVAPQGLVPALVMADATLTQSLAIAEWLEEAYPEPAILPRDPLMKAQVRAFALAIACDIHPLNNPRVLNCLRQTFAADEASIDAWYRHWVESGLAACEAMAGKARAPGARFAFGDAPGLADLCLVPQLFNARRFNCDLSVCPTLVAIDAACADLPAFAAAHPDRSFEGEAGIRSATDAASRRHSVTKEELHRGITGARPTKGGKDPTTVEAKGGRDGVR